MNLLQALKSHDLKRIARNPLPFFWLSVCLLSPLIFAIEFEPCASETGISPSLFTCEVISNYCKLNANVISVVHLYV